MGSKFNLGGVGAGLLSSVSKELAMSNKFEIRYIPLPYIVFNEMNEFNVDEIEELKFSIKTIGLKQNLEVKDCGDGKFKLITGHRRYKALTELVADGEQGFALAPCIVTDFNTVELPLSNELKELYAITTTNSEFRIYTDNDRMVQIRNLKKIYTELQKNGYSLTGKQRDFIADKLGLSAAQVQRLEFVDKNISDEFRQEIEKDNLPLTAAVAVAHLDQKEQKALFKQTEDTGSLSADTINEFSEKQKGKKERKQARKTIDDLPYDDYIIDKSNLSDIKDGISNAFVVLKDGTTLKKKEYAKLTDAKTAILKQLAIIETIINKSKQK